MIDDSSVVDNSCNFDFDNLDCTAFDSSYCMAVDYFRSMAFDNFDCTAFDNSCCFASGYSHCMAFDNSFRFPLD